MLINSFVYVIFILLKEYKFDEANWEGLAEVMYFAWIQSPDDFLKADLNRSFKVQA